MWKPLFALMMTASVVACGVLFYRNRDEWFRPDVDRVGGTLLAFDIDGEPDAAEIEKAVAVLKKRLDPTRRLGVVVRAGDDGKAVHVLVPQSPRHDAIAERVRVTAAKPGVVEMRVAAYSGNDAPVWTDLPRWKAAKPGGLPVAPPAKGRKPMSYLDRDGNEQTYEWVKLAADGGHMMRLWPGTLRDPVMQRQLDESEKNGTAFVPNGVNCVVAAKPGPVPGSPDLYLLTRDPRVDLHGERITNEHVASATLRASGGNVRPRIADVYTVRLSLNDVGKPLLSRITGVASVGATRGALDAPLLSVMADGEVYTTAAILGPLASPVDVTGNFSEEDADRLAGLFGGGVLPIKLKPKPREVELEPKK